MLARFILVCVPLAALCQQPLPQQAPQQSPTQQDSQPPAQSKPKPKPDSTDPTSKTGTADPNLLDPTKDPTKDPALDITRDPTKDPEEAVQSANPDNLRGADSSDVAAAAPDYTGPAILTRDFALSRPQVPLNEHFRWYVGASAVWDSGLLGPYTAAGSSSSSGSSEGVDLNWGASAKHYRRKDIFDLNYSGHYYNYGGASLGNGQDESLSAGYTHQASSRLSFGIRESGGLYSNTYSVLNSTAIADETTASSTIVVAPNTEAFNIRTYFSTTTGALTYQKSARLSFSLGGAFFLVRRNSPLLADSNGYQATADVAYRVTKRQTVGVYYAHSEYSFRKIFGDANADSIGANYAVSLSRTVDLSVRAGGTRYDSQTLEVVTPNPLVQEVLGITSGIEKFYFVGYSPDITVTISRRLRRSTFGASFTEGISPGNGLILTSKRQAESAYWNLPTFRRFAFQIGAGRDELSGYTTGEGTPGSYVSYYARVSASRPVTRYISSYFNLDYRQYQFNSTDYGQHEYRVGIGFRFSPGDGPVKLW